MVNDKRLFDEVELNMKVVFVTLGRDREGRRTEAAHTVSVHPIQALRVRVSPIAGLRLLISGTHAPEPHQRHHHKKPLGSLAKPSWNFSRKYTLPSSLLLDSPSARSESRH